MADMDRATSLFGSERLTLPPLHTLSLPRGEPSVSGSHEMHDSYEHQRWTHPRQPSFSSSTSSRTPSPTPSDSSSDFSSCTPSSKTLPPPPTVRHPQFPRLRLTPSSLEDADVVILVPPPDAPLIPSLSSGSPVPSRPAKAMLLVGPALKHVRGPGSKLSQGARVHPYRLACRNRKESAQPTA